jgi:hypothetical protein
VLYIQLGLDLKSKLYLAALGMLVEDIEAISQSRGDNDCYSSRRVELFLLYVFPIYTTNQRPDVSFTCSTSEH